MLDHAILNSVAEQLMSGPSVVVQDCVSRVVRTGARRLRTARFFMDGKDYQAIEQNAEKPSRWGKLAQAGHRVVQFRDLMTQKYIAVTAETRNSPVETQFCAAR